MAKFISPTSEPVHIALRNGRTALVPPDGAELDAEFQREALLLGCRLQGTAEEETASDLFGDSGKTKSQLIDDAIQAMLDGSDPADFTGDGKPNLAALSRRSGFSVTREERDAAWTRITSDQAEGD